MKFSIAIMLLLLFFSCKKTGSPKSPKIVEDSPIVIQDLQPKEKELSDEEIKRQQREDEKEMSVIIRKYTLTEKSNGFKYQIFCEEQKNGVINYKKIDVLKSGKLFQRFHVDKDSTFIYHDYEVDFSYNEDWNFDGYKDIKLTQRAGMVDQSYYLWLFDKKSGKYQLNSTFKKILNPVLHKENKEITSEYHIGSVEYHYETYKYKGGKFVKIHEQIEGDEP
ncbi:hypothetical protein [Chryseobacterium sp. EO14]|uniref:XAC2610-related protein n=1 Tax=Chryseobacterium sp. EO14 TaxID=2950551 RepID=UPI00210ADC8B|nr:hypothetical protein [Chryseobacterium sp. EO14]MCQ4140888.1 hypothetical protein [Chryseobacterium sp. EO14]